MRKIKTAVLGTGFMGRVHTEGIRRLGNVEVSAIAGSSDGLARAGFRTDYVVLRNALTLAPVGDLRREPLRLLAAAWLGKTRLIDNIAVKSFT